MPALQRNDFSLMMLWLMITLRVGSSFSLQPHQNSPEVAVAIASRLVRDQTYLPYVATFNSENITPEVASKTKTKFNWVTRPNELLVASVSGRPVPLYRHRSARGFSYNPSAKAQASFAEAAREGMADCGFSQSWGKGELNDFDYDKGQGDGRA